MPFSVACLAAWALGCSSGEEPAEHRPRGEHARERAAGERGAGERGAGERAAGERGAGERGASASEPHGHAPGPPAEPTLVRGSRPIMSTLYQITIVSEDDARAHAAIEDALDEVERLGVVLSEWRPDSEVSRINAAAGHEAVHVGRDTIANVREALRVAEWTGGAYDITWAALREFYLFQPGEQRPPDMARVRERLPLVSWRDVVLDEGAGTVMLRREGMAIGLGGIAKGWAVDRASAVLQRHGFQDFMIFGGGQVLVHGSRGDRAWRVGVQHPRRSDYIGFVEATDSSIATSGDYEHYFVAEDGTRWHHIIDLGTGLPATRSISVTIIAPTGLLADGLDTGCFVMGPERCLAMLAEHPELEGVMAVIVDSEFRLHFSPGARERFVMRVELDDEGRIPH